jgi:hypothetical protein
VSPDFKLEVDLRDNLCRLAQFGANLTDAHSCFIFLPSAFLWQDKTAAQDKSGISQAIDMCGHHSLSSDVIDNVRLSRETGLIGWVAKHNRSIHVSPFERDSRTLGVYSADQSLKSFIGIPVSFKSSPTANPLVGVIACDSKKSYAFSKLQGKLLEDLAREVANTVDLVLINHQKQPARPQWEDFLTSVSQLVSSLGRQSVEILRIRLGNSDQLEQQLGTRRAYELTSQVTKLVQQALSQSGPTFLMPNGDILAVLDNMVGALCENKVRAISAHFQVDGKKVDFAVARIALGDRRCRNVDLDSLFAACTTFESTLPRGVVNL